MNDEFFAELVASVKEGGAILRGEQPASRIFTLEPLDIKQIRFGFGLTQEQFAMLLGISVSTLRNWEQGRRVPEGPARVLLQVVAKHPEALLDTLDMGDTMGFVEREKYIAGLETLANAFGGSPALFQAIAELKERYEIA